MEKKRIYITNFATFTSHDGGGRYRVVTDDAGEEIGIEISGLLTTFNVRNENGGIFHRDSYDKFVDEYFVKNSLNVPVCLYHNDTDIRNVCGTVKAMTKTDNGVSILAWIPRSAYYYKLIKAQIDDGILQGFSNAGGVMDADYDAENDTLDIKEFALVHAALVAVPADTGATFKAQNTVFRGFTTTVTEHDEIKEQEQQSDGWQW